MKYLPASLAAGLGCLAIGVACYVTKGAYPLWAMLLVAVLVRAAMED